MRIYFTEYFKKQLKKLKKKFENVKSDLLNTLNNLDLEKEIHIGRGVYKIRIQSSDSCKGKSGSFRSYVYLYRKKDLLVPLCIYHKSEKGNIGANELKYYFERAIDDLIKLS
jgi:hypothetical protein